MARRPAEVPSAAPAGFHSVLYQHHRPDGFADEAAEPDFFRDLNIDQIVAAVTAGREAYDLKPFFRRILDDADEIAYRQEVFRDLERRGLVARIGRFAEKLLEMRSHLRAAQERHYRLNRNAWFVDAVALYCDAVAQLTCDLGKADLQSRGLRRLRDYLAGYVAAPVFCALAADTARVKAELRSVNYCLLIRDTTATVRKYQDETDYSAEIENLFAKFRQGNTKDYTIKYPDMSGMSHVDAQILDFVAKIYPDIFENFDQYNTKHQDFVDPIVERFAREIQFYIAYLQYIGKLRQAGLPFCYPRIGRHTKAIHGNGVFDLALADRLAAENSMVVGNDFDLRDGQRVIVVSGPNQGGKTTFARTFGQLHHFSGLGCPVPGTDAQLFLCDRIFAHFEREERIESLRGKLEDDLTRLHRVLEQATPNSLVVMNEIFSSTALEDAVLLATAVMREILARDCLCVCVTFLDELSTLGPSVVSMVSTVVPEDPARRTFKLIRRAADGRAYAMAIAEKYGLTYRSVKRRLAS